MNQKGKKFISLFLIFSLMMLSINLYSKEKRGAKLIITKKDGQQIRNELIAVKENSLLLLDTKGKDVSVDIGDIRIIFIVKESKVSSSGAGIGLLTGGGLGALYGLVSGPDLPPGWYEMTTGQKVIACGFLFGITGAVIGAIIGRKLDIIETIQIEGMTDLEIKRALYKLREKARIPYYK